MEDRIHELVVFIRDTTLKSWGQIRPLTATAFLRKNDVGKWAMALDGKHALTDKIDKGWGVLVYDGDDKLFTGTVNNTRRGYIGNSESLFIEGETDLHVIADRLVEPPTGVSHWSEKGFAETLIVNLFNNQVGPLAATGRQTSGVAQAASAGRGASTSVHARYTNVLTEIQALATVSGLVVDVLQEDTTQSRSLIVRVPTDRSKMIRFNPQTGLNSFESNRKAPEATVVYVGGQGTGAARTIQVVSGSEDGWSRRREIFKDRRDTNDVDELTKSANEELDSKKGIEGVSFKITESPAYKFGSHYFLGDTISIELADFGLVSDVVESVEITWNEYNREIEVFVGKDDAPAREKRDREIIQRLRRLEAQ